MNLLLDQGLPRSAADLLRDVGIKAKHVGEIGFAAAKDVEILVKARADNSVVVTLDADFHAMLALSGASSPSVIRIRIEGLRGPDLANLLMQILDEWRSELEQGAVLTVQQGRIRMRQLPLLLI
jgi:predicted nuclease of predicted toxin-antitoxin system